MRRCPLCERDLEPVVVRGQDLDRCPSCRGLYLDRGQLGALIDMVRIGREIVLDEDDIDTVPQDERGREVLCPDGH